MNTLILSSDFAQSPSLMLIFGVAIAALIGLRDVVFPIVVKRRRALMELRERGLMPLLAGEFVLFGALMVLGVLIAKYSISGLKCVVGIGLNQEHVTLIVLLTGVTVGAWICAIFAGFSEVGPGKIDFVDWGSLPIFAFALEWMAAEFKLDDAAAALLAMTGIILYWRAPTDGGIAGISTPKGISKSTGITLAILASMFAAIAIFCAGKLRGASDAAGLESGQVAVTALFWRMLATSVAFFLMASRRGGRWADFVRIGPGNHGVLSVIGILYAAPLLILFLLVTPQNSSLVTSMLCLVPGFALLFESLLLKKRIRMNTQEVIAFILIGLAVATHFLWRH